MGNSASSSARQHDDTVDYGFLTPQGVYTGPRDWNQQIVGQLIVERRLAPFYRPLEDYDESWDDEQILAARKELPEQDAATSESGSRVEGAGHTSRSASISSVKARQNSLKEPSRSPEALVYRGAIECPICFLVCLVLLHHRLALITPHFLFLFSIIRQISTTLAVATKRSVLNVSYRSSGLSLLLHI